jgi:autophagy-related protein 18
MVVPRGEPAEDDPPPISYLGFNQDQTCLAVGTPFGFSIFSTESLALLHEEACGPVALVEMLFRTSLVALVGGSSSQAPDSSCRELTMWNTKQRCNICQLHFNAKIYGVKMNHRRTVVLLQQKIHIFDLKTMKSLHVVDRAPSHFVDPALGWLCAASERGYLAMPLALTAGAGCLDAGIGGGTHLHGGSGMETEAKLGLVTVVDTYTLKPVGTAFAHKAPVQALCMNPTGQLLATASCKGTMVRLFSLPALDMVFSFRRGTSPCRIFGLLFSRDSALVCASASSGTVHVFRNSEKMLGSLPLESEDATVGAARREMSGGGVLPVVQQDDSATEFGDWDLVDEQPDRLLERMVNMPSYADGRSGKSALQKLAAVSGKTAAQSARYARTLLQMLPQDCRELVDAPRAFAWAHLRDGEEDREREATDLLGKLPLAEGFCAAVLGGSSSMLEGGVAATGRYVACVLPRPGGNCRAQVLVATVRGNARFYDWCPAAGGECGLRSERFLAGPKHQHAHPGVVGLSAVAPLGG